MSSTSTLPHPRSNAAFYEGVPFKRLIAWLIDLAFTAAIAAVLSAIVSLFGLVLILPFLLLPLIWALTGFAYRWLTIGTSSATWGMQIMAIELRDRDGLRLDRKSVV